MAIGNVSVSITGDASGFWRDFRAKTSGEGDRIGKETGERVRRSAQAEVARGVKVKVDADTTQAQAQLETLKKEGDKSSAGLLKSILPLAPALAPLAGAATAAGAAFGAMGAVALLAFKGAQAEIKAGTTDGQAFAAGVGVMKSSLTSLEATASHGVLTGFQTSVASLTSALPGLNTQTAAISQQLGDIGSHVIGGIAGSFTTFGPVIQQVLGYVDQLASKFETWASGPGGASFASALGTDFEQALPVLQNLATAAVHLIAALNSTGQGSLGFLGQFSGLIAHIPVGVLEAGTTAYLAFRAAVTVTAGLTAASAALKGFAASEATAAAAGGALAARTAGGMAAIIGRATPYVAALVAADFATQALVKTNNSWSRSNSTLRYGLGQVGAAFSAVAQFKNPFSAVDANASARGFSNAIQPVIDAYERIRQEDLQIGRGTLYSTAEPYAARNLRTIATNASLLADALRGSTVNLSGATQSINAYSTNLANAAASEQKWLTQGKDTGKVINGVAVYTDTWAAAVAATGNNSAAAADLIAAHADALRDDQAAAAKAAQEAANLSAAVSAAGSKYHLTADQVSLYGSALGITAQQVASGAISARQFSGAIGAVSRAFANGNDAIQGWLADLSKIDLSSNTLTTRVAVLGAGLKALQGVTLDMAGANLQAVSSVQGVATAISKNNQSIGANGQLLGQLVRTTHGYIVQQPKLTAGSLQIQQAMSQAGASAITLAQNIYQNTGSARKASDAYYGLRQSLIQNLEQMGYFPAKARKIADSVYGIPNKKFVSFLQKGDLPSAIRSLSTSLTNFTRQFDQILIHLGIIDQASGPLQNVHDILNNIPDSKTITVTYQTVGNLGSTTRSQVPGSAAGSASWTPDGKLPPGLSTVGERGWELVSTDARGRSQVFSHAQSVAMTGLPKNLPGYAAGTSAAAAAARVQSTNSLVSDAHSLFGALSGGVRGMRAAVAAFIKDFKAAGATTRQTARAAADQQRLIANQQKLVAARALLTKVTDYSSSVKGSLSSGFDLTKYGSVADLVTGLKGQTGQDNAFAREVNKLRREAHGNKSQLNLINNLAASGQSTSLEALASGSARDLANAGKAYRGYNQSLQAGADAASRSKYGVTQSHASRDVDRLVARQERLMSTLASLGATIAHSHGKSGAHVERQLEHFAHVLEIEARHGRN